jgi:hypothetical protein
MTWILLTACPGNSQFLETYSMYMPPFTCSVTPVM